MLGCSQAHAVRGTIARANSIFGSSRAELSKRIDKNDALTTFVVQCSRSGSGLVPAPVIKAHLNGLRRVHGLFYSIILRGPIVISIAAPYLLRVLRVGVVSASLASAAGRFASLSAGSPLSPARSSSAGAPTLLPGFAVRWQHHGIVGWSRARRSRSRTRR